MSHLPDDMPIEFFSARDGARLAYRVVETPDTHHYVLLLHGFLSNGYVNWIRYGHARTLSEAGFRVIMPDLRGHGHSAHPDDPGFYPPDVLVRDAFDLIQHLSLTDYDLVGYSLGSRTAARLVANGARPNRLVLSGLGLSQITTAALGQQRFDRLFDGLGAHQRGTDEWRSEAFMRSTGTDPVAARLLLVSSMGVTAEQLEDILTPTLVLMGSSDDDHGSGRALADLLPVSRYEEIPGNHMSAVSHRALGTSIRDFLTD